ncbi:MAG: kelch repeat-containing protein [Bacteroidia bacterium]
MKTQISTRILTWLALALLQIGAVQGQPIWTQKADHLGAARYDFAGFSANGKGYIGGGRYAGPFNAISEWQEFNPLMNSWSMVAAMPLPYTGLNAFEVGGYGYVCNGVNDITYNYDTQRYNHLGNNWGTFAAMNYPRLHAASASNGAKGYIIGGYGFMAEPLRDLWEYDPILDSWTERDTLPFAAARYNATAFSIDGNVFLFGGWNDVDYLSDLWKYDTTTMHWTQVSSMPATGRELSLAMVLNGEAYIVGGIRSPAPRMRSGSTMRAMTRGRNWQISRERMRLRAGHHL